MHYIYYILSAILVIIVIIVMLRGESYSMTAGMYGQPEPKGCSYDKPSVRYKDIFTCKACGLQCSTKDADDNCQKCMQTLNQMYAGIL